MLSDKIRIEPISDDPTRKTISSSTSSSSKPSNSLHLNGTFSTPKLATPAESSHSLSSHNKQRSKTLSGMSTKHAASHKRHRSDRVKSTQTTSSTVNIIGSQENSSNANTRYPCQRFLTESLTYFLFLTSFFLSLTLYSIGQASGRITIDTTEPKSAQQSGSYGIWTFLGFLGVMYSMIGSIMHCFGKLPFKVNYHILIWGLSS